MAARRLIRGAQALLSDVYRRVTPRGIGQPGPGRSDPAHLGLVLPATPVVASWPDQPAPGSTPQRRDIRNQQPGRMMILSGRVLDRRCRPMANARLAFRQPVEGGAEILTGHQYSSSSGSYRLTARRPSSSAEPILQVQVEHADAPPLETLLFLPDQGTGEPRHRAHCKSLWVSYRERTDEVLNVRFDFVLDRV